MAGHILSVFDARLSEYALESFTKRDVVIKTGSHIQSVEADCFHTKEDGRILCSMLIWATGNKQVPLLDKLRLDVFPVFSLMTTIVCMEPQWM